MAASKSSGSVGSRAPESGATPSSIPEEEEEELEEEGPKLVTRKRTRVESVAGAHPTQKTTVVKEPDSDKVKDPEVKKTKFVIIPPRTTEREAEKKVKEPAGDTIPEKETLKKTETATNTKQDKAQGPEAVHITGLDQPLKSAQVRAQVAHKDAFAAGAIVGGSGVGSQKGNGKRTRRPRSPIGAEDTLGYIYYKTYSEEKRGEAPHVLVWSLKKKDTFVEFGACRDWFLGTFPPG
ncbi:hypothetical protein Hanom_Chr10g00902101 [Helianthus anomalus]